MSFLIITSIAAAFALPHVFAYSRDYDGRWHQHRFNLDRKLAAEMVISQRIPPMTTMMQQRAAAETE